VRAAQTASAFHLIEQKNHFKILKVSTLWTVGPRNRLVDHFFKLKVRRA
jgi:hypothetical protein